MLVELHGRTYASGNYKREQVHPRAPAGYFARQCMLPLRKVAIFLLISAGQDSNIDVM